MSTQNYTEISDEQKKKNKKKRIKIQTVRPAGLKTQRSRLKKDKNIKPRGASATP
jgi:hypothetical protein